MPYYINTDYIHPVSTDNILAPAIYLLHSHGFFTTKSCGGFTHMSSDSPDFNNETGIVYPLYQFYVSFDKVYTELIEAIEFDINMVKKYYDMTPNEYLAKNVSGDRIFFDYNVDVENPFTIKVYLPYIEDSDGSHDVESESYINHPFIRHWYRLIRTFGIANEIKLMGLVNYHFYNICKSAVDRKISKNRPSTIEKKETYVCN